MKAIKSLKISLVYLPFLILLGLNSCKHENLEIDKSNENFRPAADFVKNNYDLSLFSAAIEKAGMSAQLNGAGPFTILAPDNAAFNAIGIMRPSDFDKMNPDSLKGLVQRHVLGERLLLQDIPVNGVDVRYRTLGGTETYTTLATYALGHTDSPVNDLYFDGSTVIRKDVNLSNGVLQELNKVMEYNAVTVQDWLNKHPQYSTFVIALKKFGLWDKLATEGPFTVFAPNNKAFEDQGITVAAINDLDTGSYTGNRLFGSYILDKKHFFISDIQAFKITANTYSYNYALENDTWSLTINVVKNDGSQLITYSLSLKTANPSIPPYQQADGLIPALADNLCGNGVVHDLQGILLLPAQASKN